MSTHVSASYSHPMKFHPSRALNFSASAWVATALVGQWIFAFYILVVFMLPLAAGTPENISPARLITGYVQGDTLGNLMLFAHLVPAFVLMSSGILQLLPVLRRRYPVFHRWNGRVFLSLGLAGALTGLYLTWGRGTRLSDIGAIGITLNGLLIPVAIGFAWYFARQRRFDQHMRWAIHSFILVNGVWSFRLYLMGWYLLHQGPYGNNRTLDGPADLAFSFLCYALPMLLAELFFWARRHPRGRGIWLVTGVLSLGCLATAGCVVAATAMMWGPRIGQALAG